MTSQEAVVPRTGAGRRSRVALVAVLAMLIIGAAIAFAVPWWMNQRHADVWAGGMSDGDAGFSVALEHDRISAEGAQYLFTTGLGWEDLVAEMEAVYPEGHETGDGEWAVAVEDTVFVLAPLGGDGYVVAAQFVLLGDTEQGGVNVSFPSLAWGSDVISEGQSVDIGWDTNQWHDFYGLLGISDSGGVYLVPTSGGTEAAVSVDSSGVATIEQVRAPSQ